MLRLVPLTVTSNGKLEWHNWFHTIGGAIYDFRMWKDMDPVSSQFELYMPIIVGRASWGSGIGGSPPLHIYVTLYDVAGIKLFSVDTVQDFCIRSITASFYGSATTSSVSLAGVSYKLWQNSSGAYFSYDNGTSVMASGRFYTDPARVEIRFYIWEHNNLQPYSDEEYWVDIDGVSLLPSPLPSPSVLLVGLPAGSWYLVDGDGGVIKNATVGHSGTITAGKEQVVNGVLAGLCDYTYAKRGTFYTNTTITYNDDGNFFTVFQNSSSYGLIVRDVPANDVVNVYVGDALFKTVVSNGSPVTIPPSEITYPFSGRVEVISRPYTRPLASYAGTIEWNDQLAYSGGALVRSGSNTSLIHRALGSECNHASGWSLTYNLLTGGTPPSLSASGGYVRMDEPYLHYSGTVMEAYYRLNYPINATGENFTVSLWSDACFSFSSTGDIFVQYAEIKLYYVSGGAQHLLAATSQSLTPILNVTLTNVSPSSVITMDKIIVEVHAYARCRRGESLYSSGDWARVDYLRVNYSSVPNGFAGVPITGLQQGWRAVFGTGTYWANSSGALTIPVGASSWPSSKGVAVCPASESYITNFTPGMAYYPLTNKTYEPETDTIYYEVSSEDYSYRVELRLLSAIMVPGKSGATHVLNFTYLVYENGALRERGVPVIYVNGLRAAVTRLSDAYSTSFSTPGNVQYVNFSLVDCTGIRLACRLKVTK